MTQFLNELPIDGQAEAGKLAFHPVGMVIEQLGNAIALRFATKGKQPASAVWISPSSQGDSCAGGIGDWENNNVVLSSFPHPPFPVPKFGDCYKMCRD